MVERSRITGLVLAGGRGARMGSVDKGLEAFDGKPLVAHAIDRLAGQVGHLVVSANRHRDVYEAFGYPVVADLIDGHAGPLAGLHAALATCTTDYLVAVPCDAPFFPLDLVARLAEAFDADGDVAMAATPVRAHPVFCMVRRGARESLASHLAAGDRSVTSWLAALGVRAVSFADEEAFRNLNTFEELRAARP